MFREKAVRVILPLLAGLAAIAALYVNAHRSDLYRPHFKEGVLDLSAWEGDIGKAFQLAGEWEFYWDKLLTAADIKKGIEEFFLVEAPSQWNDYQGNLPGMGEGTYRIHVKGAVAGAEYGVRIQNMASVYRLYIDNKLVAQNGSFGDGANAPVSAYRPQLASFIPDQGSFDIILQVSNHAYAVGGMWEPIIFGRYEQVFAFDRTQSFLGALSYGGLTVMCLFFLIFFAAYPREKDMIILVGIGALMIIRLMIFGDVLVAVLFPGLLIAMFGWIDYLTLVWIQFLLLYFVYSAYGGIVPQWQSNTLLVYTAGISLFILFCPFEIVVSTYKVMNIILILIIATVTFHLVRAARAGREGASALLGAMFLILLLIPYNIFVSDYSLAGYLIPNTAYDYMALFFVQCYIVARRYNRAHKMEVALLKSQIHPHFIHNSLAAIISVSRSNAERARELLMEFSNYLRGFYDYESDQFISLAQELEFVKSYVALEQVRFGERLRAEYRIEVDDFLLPPLILQPLVENAFVHGLREKEDGGTVLIYAIKGREGSVRIGVKDDGAGLKPRDKESDRHGIGIENINRRLARIYRTRLVFCVPEGGGCEVYMEIPFRKVNNYAGVHC